MESIIHGNKNTTDLCNRLKQAETQYPILNKTEERKLIDKYKHDRDKLNELLFMHNIRMVFNIAKKYVAKTNDFDGLIQDGMIGLAEAARRFDVERDIKFSTYCSIWIRKYILMNFYGNQIDIDKHSTSLDLPSLHNSKNNSDKDVTFENYVNTYIDPCAYHTKNIREELSANEQSEICNKLMNHLNHNTELSATDKAVFIDAFYNKEKPRDIAEKYNMSMSNVNEIKHKILGIFKDILTNDYNIHSFDELIAI